MTKISLKVILFFFVCTTGIYYLSFAFVWSLKAPACFFVGKHGVRWWLVRILLRVGTALQCNAEKILPRMQKDRKLPQNGGIPSLFH